MVKNRRGFRTKACESGMVGAREGEKHLPETFAAIEKATISYPEEHSQGLQH
jgi:hypothetical protein